MLKQLRQVAQDLKKNLSVYQLALKDPRTPRTAKILLGLALGYTMLPFDLIPDFIPVIGQLDDLVVIPTLIRLALMLIPKEVIDECRLRVSARAKSAPPRRAGRRR